MNASASEIGKTAAPSDASCISDAEFETALREIEARVDRRLLEEAELRFSLERELAAERSRADEQEREVDRLRLEVKRIAQAAASAEAKLNAFEQMLEAVEDDIDERIASVELMASARLSEARAEVATNKARLDSMLLQAAKDRQTSLSLLEAENSELRGEIPRLKDQLSQMQSTWVWRTRSGIRKLFAIRS